VPPFEHVHPTVAQEREPHHDPIVDLMTGRVPWAWLDEAIAGPDDRTAK
jgi:hypothetical protein